MLKIFLVTEIRKFIPISEECSFYLYLEVYPQVDDVV